MMLNNTEDSEEYFMGLIFWLLAGISNLLFIGYIAEEITYWEIETNNRMILEEQKLIRSNEYHRK